MAALQFRPHPTKAGTRRSGRGISMILVDDLLFLPVDGFKFILKQLQQVAEGELNDESVIKSHLLELQMQLELEDITEEEYKEREAELFTRLRAIKQQQF